MFADKKVRKPGNGGAESIVKGLIKSPNNQPAINFFPIPLAVNGQIAHIAQIAQTFLLNVCTQILKIRNMIQTKLMTHKWSKCRKGW